MIDTVCIESQVSCRRETQACNTCMGVAELEAPQFNIHKHIRRTLILEKQFVTYLFKIVPRLEQQLTIVLTSRFQRPVFDYIKCQDYLNFQNKVPHVFYISVYMLM